MAHEGIKGCLFGLVVYILLLQCTALYPNDTNAAKAFCTSPMYKHTSCGFASDAEREATTYEQCVGCGRAYWGIPSYLPMNITTAPPNYVMDQTILQVISLACQGRVVVRAVFKILNQPSIETSPQSNHTGTNCSFVRMTYVDDEAISSGGDATPVVRCELQLPDGPGKEEQRALQAKEIKCYLCERCHDGKGCPANTGVWYSDSYTTLAQGCHFDQQSYQAHRVGINIDPGPEILLVKFEACNSPPCFNSSYEAEKLKTAGRCYRGQCLDPRVQG